MKMHAICFRIQLNYAFERIFKCIFERGEKMGSDVEYAALFSDTLKFIKNFYAYVL